MDIAVILVVVTVILFVVWSVLLRDAVLWYLRNKRADFLDAAHAARKDIEK